MSALNILGGIGAGVQKGVGFMQQKKMQDESLALQQERQDWQRAEFEQKKQANELEDWMGEQYRTIYARDDLDDYGKAAEYTKTILPRAKPEHIEIARKATDSLYQQLGVKGVDALTRGDVSTLQRLADARAPGTRILMKDGVISVNKPDGSVSQIDRNGLISMLELTKAAETLAARSAADLDRQAKEAKIDADRALAGYRDRSPMARTGGAGGAGGSRASSRSGSGGGTGGDQGFNVLETAEEYRKAFGDVGLEGWDVQNGFQTFTQLRDNNPDLARTESGQAVMLRLSRDLARPLDPEAVEDMTDEQRAALPRLSPEIGADGRLDLFAHVGPHTMRLESGVSEDRLMRTKGLDGKPLAASANDVGTIYMDAVKRAAERDPQIFNAAVVAARNPEIMQKARDAAARGDQGAQRTLAWVPVVLRADQYAQTLPVKGVKGGGGSSEGAPALTTQQQEVADALGVDPRNEPSLIDALGATAKQVGSGLAEGAKSVALTAAGANQYQRAFQVEATLDEFSRARTPAVKRMLAAKLIEMTGDDPELAALIKARISKQ